MASLSVGQVFDTFSDAENTVVTFCKENFHPIRIDSKEVATV